jgi:hypothetical protein
MRRRLARFRKAIAPALNVLAQPAVLALFHGEALGVAEVILTIATLTGVIAAKPNAPRPARMVTDARPISYGPEA